MTTAKRAPGADLEPTVAPTHVHGPDCDHGHEVLQPYRREEPKLGRNDPCHCGSGRKYKKCHGAAE